MPDLAVKSCADFTDALASSQPVPGGGGAAALTGALAASLGAMAARISVPRKKDAAARMQLEQRVLMADILRERLLGLIDGDAAGFAPLAAAYAIPKEDPQRQAKLREASIAACKAPMEMLRCCSETARLLEELSDLVSPLLLSDVGCAAALCGAALESAAMNVWVNTRGLKEDLEAEDLNEQVRTILAETMPKTRAIVGSAAKKLQS